MIPIRLRVIFLALVSLLFLLIVIYDEHKDIQKDLLGAKNSLLVVGKISQLSQLIHPLQKERGLTATYLIKHNEALYYNGLKI